MGQQPSKKSKKGTKDKDKDVAESSGVQDAANTTGTSLDGASAPVADKAFQGSLSRATGAEASSSQSSSPSLDGTSSYLDIPNGNGRHQGTTSDMGNGESSQVGSGSQPPGSSLPYVIIYTSASCYTH